MVGSCYNLHGATYLNYGSPLEYAYSTMIEAIKGYAQSAVKRLSQSVFFSLII